LLGGSGITDCNRQPDEPYLCKSVENRIWALQGVPPKQNVP
jgi:hypothetical protein